MLKRIRPIIIERQGFIALSTAGGLGGLDFIFSRAPQLEVMRVLSGLRKGNCFVTSALVVPK